MTEVFDILGSIGKQRVKASPTKRQPVNVQADKKATNCTVNRGDDGLSSTGFSDRPDLMLRENR